MKDHRLTRWCIVFSALVLAWFWFFPSDLFRDCIHVVFCAAPDGAQTDAEPGDSRSDGAPDDAREDSASSAARTDAEPSCALTEEDYLDLFHMESGEYKIAWKFF